MFHKPKRNYRGRKDDSDEESMGSGLSVESKQSNPISVRPSAKMSTLSFGDDESEGRLYESLHALLHFEYCLNASKSILSCKYFLNLNDLFFLIFLFHAIP